MSGCYKSCVIILILCCLLIHSIISNAPAEIEMGDDEVAAARIGVAVAGCLKLISMPFLLFSAAQCLLMCLVRWSLLINLRSQIEQTNFFSPVCVRLWRESSSLRENCRPQPSHVHVNGFSPVNIFTFIIIYCIEL